MLKRMGRRLLLPGEPVVMSEGARVTLCIAAGSVVGSVAAVWVAWQLAVLLGWIMTTLIVLAWVWNEIGGIDANATASVATREDDSRSATRVVIVVASVISLAAVVFGLHRASSASSGLEVALTVAAMLTVVLSWLVVHTFFILRYAHLYYGVGQAGGIEFPGDEPPNYRDFAYLGFTAGMTFQVSDTSITEPIIRSTVLRHALVSYLFGTAIIASTISVLAGSIG